MATTNFSVNDKNYILPDSDGYIPVGEKINVGNPVTPVYLINGKLKPIHSYSGKAYIAQKMEMKKSEDNGKYFLTAVENIEDGNKDMKALRGVSATASDDQLVYFNIGDTENYQGALRLFSGGKKDCSALIFSNKLTDDREYALPDKDGTFAMVSDGNNYAEFRLTDGTVKAGQVVKEAGDGSLTLTTKRLERGCEITSDTCGFSVGEEAENTLPVVIAGRVLAYPDKDPSTFIVGTPVCSGKNGTVSQMTDKEEKAYPSRIIGVVSEIPTYETWKGVPVDGRIWIRVR